MKRRTSASVGDHLWWAALEGKRLALALQTITKVSGAARPNLPCWAAPRLRRYPHGTTEQCPVLDKGQVVVYGR